VVAVVVRLLQPPITQEVLVVQVEVVVQDLVILAQEQEAQETHHQYLRHKDPPEAQA
jgi:hypothetical protein